MIIKKHRKKSAAVSFLENITGGALTLGGLLEAIRNTEEISQQEFALQLGISKSHLCYIEKGRKNVSPERAAKFAKILGYSPSHFVKLSLQAQIKEAGLTYDVELKKVA